MIQDNDSILRAPQVCERIGLSRPTLWRLVRSGEFPGPIPLTTGGRAVGWSSNEVAAWLEGRVRSREGRLLRQVPQPGPGKRVGRPRKVILGEHPSA